MKSKSKKLKSTRKKVSRKSQNVKNVVNTGNLDLTNLTTKGITEEAWEFMNEIEDIRYEY